jgi:hypothetical protein
MFIAKGRRGMLLYFDADDSKNVEIGLFYCD